MILGLQAVFFSRFVTWVFCFIAASEAGRQTFLPAGSKTTKLHIKFCLKRRNFSLRFGHYNTVTMKILTLRKRFLTTFLNNIAIIVQGFDSKAIPTIFIGASQSVRQMHIENFDRSLGTDPENLYPNLSENFLP